MPDARRVAGSKWPRGYSSAELKILKPLFKAVGVEFSPAIVEQLQTAVHGLNLHGTCVGLKPHATSVKPMASLARLPRSLSTPA